MHLDTQKIKYSFAAIVTFLEDSKKALNKSDRNVQHFKPSEIASLISYEFTDINAPNDKLYYLLDDCTKCKNFIANTDFARSNPEYYSSHYDDIASSIARIYAVQLAKRALIEKGSFTILVEKIPHIIAHQNLVEHFFASQQSAHNEVLTFIQEINTLIEDLEKLDLAAPISNFVLTNLRRIREVLHAHAYFNYEDLSETSDAILGSFLRHVDDLRSADLNDEQQQAVKKSLTIFGRFRAFAIEKSTKAFTMLSEEAAKAIVSDVAVEKLPQLAALAVKLLSSP